MKELWEQAISLLPATKFISTFGLNYRPWIRDKTHLYMLHFYFDNGYWRNITQVPPKGVPYWNTGFGRTPEEAIQNFIDKWNKYVSNS
jgi:hypothetical protein